MIRGSGGREAERERRGKEGLTCLVLGIRGEILAVEVRGQDDAPWRVRVFRRDDVREGLWAIWR
jgi:hypothetical protein